MIVLADTSVWIDHLRGEDTRIAEMLDSNVILIHPMVIGELACGNIRNRAEVLTRTGRLPMSPVVSEDDLLSFIKDYRLMGRDIDYVDVHLLASVAITADALLWSRDRRLMDAAAELNIAWQP